MHLNTNKSVKVGAKAEQESGPGACRRYHLPDVARLSNEYTQTHETSSLTLYIMDNNSADEAKVDLLCVFVHGFKGTDSTFGMSGRKLGRGVF